MKKSIFMTGIAGSGKSTVGKELSTMGYKVYDMEDESYGLFIYDNSDADKINDGQKIFNIAKLEELLDNQAENLAFYSGVAKDNEKVLHLFEASILLRVRPEVLNKRLLAREGTNSFANTKAVRQRVLDWKDEFERNMIQAGMQIVDNDHEIRDVAEAIIQLVRFEDYPGRP